MRSLKLMRRGGQQFGNKSYFDFNNFIISAGLFDVGFSGSKYTWSNNQNGRCCIWMSLDIFLLNGMTVTNFPEIQVTHVPRIQFDQWPILSPLLTESVHTVSLTSTMSGFTTLAMKLLLIPCGKVELAHVNPFINCHLKFGMLISLPSFLRCIMLPLSTSLNL